MAQIIKTLKEQAIDHLSVVDGEELDLTCNLTSSNQIKVILESEAHAMLGSRFSIRTTERLLRLTCSFQARHRQDIVEIAKQSPLAGGPERCCRWLMTSGTGCSGP